MSTSEHASAASSKPAKSPTTISSSAVISETATLTGRHHITIGSNTVIHPRCKILSNNGPVIIGSGCIISERSVVGLSISPAERLSEKDESLQIVIGDSVVIEIGAKVEARIVDEGSCIGVNSHVSPGVVIGKYCRLGPLSTIATGEVLADRTVMYGGTQRRIDHHKIMAREVSVRGKQVEVLRGLVAANARKWRS